jgi:hypothetical protein
MFRFIFLVLIGLLPFITASPTPVDFMKTMATRDDDDANMGSRLVFCHFMVRHVICFCFSSLLLTGSRLAL